MDLSNAAIAVVLESESAEPVAPAAILRGTARGLEAIIDGKAPIDAIVAALEARIAEAPAFFKGSDVRIAVEDGPLAPGCLARLDQLAAQLDLRIVEVAAHAAPKPAAVTLAIGSAPAAVPAAPLSEIATEPTAPVVLVQPAPAPQPAPALAPPAAPAAAPAVADVLDAVDALAPTGPRLVVGPVRSGVILDHVGHVVVFGDVNPGAEVRATGNIVVLGRLRGTAHAGIGAPMGFILALRLEPQQLRIGRQVARAADSDTPFHDAEIAYATGEQIVVERYQGRLPRNLATSL